MPIAAAWALLVGLAVDVPALEESALVAALLIGAAWLLLDGWIEARSLASARCLLALAQLCLVVGPAIVLVSDPDLFAGGPPQSLSGGLSLLALGTFSILLGSRLGSRHGFGDRAEGWATREVLPERALSMWACVAVLIVASASVAAFLVAVDGPREYFGNLDKSGATTAGLTYLTWGILFTKYGGLVILGEKWSAGRPSGLLTAILSGIALFPVAALGSRLLLLVAAMQALLLFVFICGTSRRFFATLAVALVTLVVVAVGLGEFRRWQGIGRGATFSSYLVDFGIPQLRGTYVNQYADAVRLAVIVRRIVPEQAGYEYGKELARMTLHPLPRGIRPSLEPEPGLKEAFTSGNLSGSALPVPVVGYIQAGAFGIVLISLALGYVAGGLDRILRSTRDVGVLLALIAAGTGLIVVFRGSLTQAFALAAIDIVGFFVAHRILYRRIRAKPMPTHAP